MLVADPAATVDHLIGAAVLDIELSDSASALLHLDRALSIGQRESDAQFFKALALIQLNDVSGALEALGAVGPSTNYGRALQEAAAILVSQGDIGAANAFFEEHRQVHADGAELNFALHAETLQTLGSIEAESVLSRGISAFPTSTRLLRESQFRERAGSFDLAEADYRQILNLNPGDANALNALGYALTNNTIAFKRQRDCSRRPFPKIRAIRPSSTVLDGFTSNWVRTAKQNSCSRKLTSNTQILRCSAFD